MTDTREILLTNDDGIDSPGLVALYSALSALEDTSVTAVAPADDQSAMGRAKSQEVTVTEHELGYVVTGTPVDCTIVGTDLLTTDPDLVVSGINRGANLGDYVLGRSGTVSAAVEAAFSGIPAIAASLYIPAQIREIKELELTPGEYAAVVDITTYLVETALDSGIFERADYLNVNAPIAQEETEPAEVRITRPSTRYEVIADWMDRETGQVSLNDRIWERMAAGDLETTPGTDRHAILNGAVSVSPLQASHELAETDTIEGLIDQYNDSLVH